MNHANRLPQDNPNIDISIIVGTYNRADMLRQTLDSLVALETQLADGSDFRYEVVVVDNASSDHTPQVIAEANPGAACAVRGFHESDAGVAFARNRGILESQGRWIAFHDDDQVAHPRWLAELLDLATRRNVKCVGGNVLLRLPEENDREFHPECRGLLGERWWMTEEQEYNRKNMPGTNNLLVRRSVLDEVGLFNVALTDGGEDADLTRRIRAAGYRAWYTPDSIVYHLIPAKRLNDEYMRWTSLRKGQHVARRERLDWGRAALLPVTIARIGQAMFHFMPRYLAARVSGDRERTLGMRCLLWRSQGYLRQAAQLLVGKNPEITAGGKAMNLREGRESLVANEPQTAGS